MLYRREEEILAFLVLGKMLCGGHCAAGDHVLMTMLLGPLCQSLDNFGLHIPEAPVALGNVLAMKGFWGFTVCPQFCGYHESESGALWKI